MSSLLHTTALAQNEYYLDTVDPRARIVVAVAVSVMTVAAGRLDTIIVALAVACVGLALCGLPIKIAMKRLLPLNVVMLLLLLLLPLSTPGATAWQVGPFCFSGEGLLLAVVIAMKGNAVLMTFIALLGTMDPIALGHALGHLRVPDKLTHLLLFTVRYLDVLHREYLRLRTAMKTRAFRPRMDRHTYRSLGYLVGMLLVRSFDRAERIAAAMKCRGFQGRFCMLDHFAFARRDVVFCMAAAALVLLLLGMESL